MTVHFIDFPYESAGEVFMIPLASNRGANMGFQSFSRHGHDHKFVSANHGFFFYNKHLAFILEIDFL